MGRGAEKKIVQNSIFHGKRHDNKILKVKILLSRKFVVMAQAPIYSSVGCAPLPLPSSEPSSLHTLAWLSPHDICHVQEEIGEGESRRLSGRMKRRGRPSHRAAKGKEQLGKPVVSCLDQSTVCFHADCLT